MTQKTLFSVFLFFLCPFLVAAQKAIPPGLAIIYLGNPSFEDLPHAGTRLTGGVRGWVSCGQQSSTTPPDVQPGHFNVTQAASHGGSYVGLVVRDDETWEGITQHLSQPLQAGKKYEFSIDLCRSETYRSASPNHRTTVMSFADPVKVIVWGGNGYCDKAEKLFETRLIENTNWSNYKMIFAPKSGNYTYFTIQAYFKTPILLPYNGNVLVDNASPIKEFIEKPKPPAVIKPAVVKKDKTKPDDVVTKPNQPAQPPTPVVVAAKEKPQKDVDGADAAQLKKGDILSMSNLYFDADQYAIKDGCLPTLFNLLSLLEKNKQLKIEIGGHTNNLVKDDVANRLSASRAKAVSDWIIGHGIAADRVLYKGYGKTQPLSENTTEEGRRKNQRVEIKVL